ncbi:TPA: hypothetical protein ACF3I9_004436 [Klebsiella aerogenes]
MSRQTAKAALFANGMNVSLGFFDLKQFNYNVSEYETEAVIFPMDHIIPDARDLFRAVGHNDLFLAIERILLQNKVCVNVTSVTQIKRHPVNGEDYAEYKIIYNGL